VLPPYFATLLVLVSYFLLASVYFGLTAHAVARAVIGPVPIGYSLAVGLAPAMGLVSAGTYSLLAAPLVAIPLDYFAIVTVYDVETLLGAKVLASHVVVAALGWLGLSSVLLLL